MTLPRSAVSHESTHRLYLRLRHRRIRLRGERLRHAAHRDGLFGAYVGARPPVRGSGFSQDQLELTEIPVDAGSSLLRDLPDELPQWTAGIAWERRRRR